MISKNLDQQTIDQMEKAFLSWSAFCEYARNARNNNQYEEAQKLELMAESAKKIYNRLYDTTKEK